MPEPLFFAYDPRALRAGLFLGAVACAALGAWALANALAQGAIQEWARFGVAASLLGAFGYVSWRVRPREEWGVRIEPLGMTMSRPLTGEKLEVVWSQIAEVRRQPKALIIQLRPEGRLLLSRHLFPSRAVYDALARALEDRVPSYDA